MRKKRIKVNEKKRIKVIDKDTAIQYLQDVLKEWDAFCKSHKQFIKAIKILLQEFDYGKRK